MNYHPFVQEISQFYQLNLDLEKGVSLSPKHNQLFRLSESLKCWNGGNQAKCLRDRSILVKIYLFIFTKIDLSPPVTLTWSGGAMMLGKLSVPGRPTCFDCSRARAYCAFCRCGWGLFGHFFSHLSFLSSFSLSLWETARYRLKYCLKGRKPKTNQPTLKMR